jgi:hypothetical protein
LVPGNLPTDIRYRVKNKDGSISTVRTMSIGTDQGEVLIPTVINNRVVSDKEAIDHYYKTGENFGVFGTPEEATAYAKDLHNYHDSILQAERSKPGGKFAPVGVPGEQITSTRRTAAHNKAVGGVSNSYHLTGQARDSVPPPGMSMVAYYRRLKALNPNYDVINEGDHVHIEPKG